MGDQFLDKASEIGKTVGSKAAEYSNEAAKKASDLSEDLLDKASDIGKVVGTKAAELGGDIAEKTGGLRDAILHSAEGTINMVNKSETLKKVASTTEHLGDKILSAGEDLVKKGGDQIEKLGGAILGENHENLDKVKDFTTKLGSKVMETKEKLVHKAEDTLDDINDTIDDFIAKEKEIEAIEANRPVKPLRETLDKHKSSMLDDEDDFFSKAEKFGDGNYGAVLEGKITVEKSSVPPAQNKPITPAAGFEDLDGDGNELIDDAIIEEE